jgi:hypothetical protein
MSSILTSMVALGFLLVSSTLAAVSGQEPLAGNGAKEDGGAKASILGRVMINGEPGGGV